MRSAGLFATLLLLAMPLAAEERTERFDKDPGWDGHNNRAAKPEPRTIKQDFGHSRTTHASATPGEVGGFITAAGEPAYYARKIGPKTFNDPLSASGKLTCSEGGFHVLIGFFNAGTLNEWRTPNTIALRISGRGDRFHAYVEYCTGRWRAGGDSPTPFPMVRDPKRGRMVPAGFPIKGKVYAWSIRYDPKGNNSRGVITATVGDHTAVCHLSEGHKADGATFNRFGLLNVMKSADGGSDVWLGELSVDGARLDLGTDAGWEGAGNRRSYVTANVRPRFDFGYSPTSYAGGKGKGELGGLSFRGDCRFAERMACYGDRLEELTLEKPLRARGTVCLRRGVTDSAVLIGFYHSRDSMKVNPSQDNGLPACFLGVSTDGPSREGFYFAPVYRVNGKGKGFGVGKDTPHIYPDGKARTWSLEYSPGAAGGQVALTLEGQTVRLELKKGDRATGARFDRFGIVTTWVDGNGQHIYFDDLTYTCKQD